MISSLFIALIMHNLVVGYGSTYPARRLLQNHEVINPSNGWEEIGTVADIENLVITYPASEHEFGIRYNQVFDVVRPVIINTWNQGIIISTINDYPFGTETTTLKFGRTLFMKNLKSGLSTTTDFYRAYYYLTNNQMILSMDETNANMPLFARKTNPWIEVGVLNDITSLKDTYPYSKYEYGIKYNSAVGYIQKITTSTWNIPIKISSVHSYPMGDNAKKMRFGKDVFMKILAGTPKDFYGQEIEVEADNWYHSYYIEQDDTYWYSKNGPANHFRIYVRFLGSEYKQIGVLSDLSSLVNKYTPLKFEYATTYNSRTSDTGLVYRPITENTWENKGSRISTIDNYPFFGIVTSLEFGKVVFTQNLDGTPIRSGGQEIETNSNDWYHNYYSQQNDKYVRHSNGDSNDIQLYARETNNPWIEIGVLSKLDVLISDHPLTKYEYGVQYMCNYIGNTFVRPVTMNIWNGIGIRVSTIHNYPFGVNLNALKFGKIVFTKGLQLNPKNSDGQEIETNPDDWYQNYYYQQNDEYHYSDGNANDVKICVRSMVIKTNNPTKAPTPQPTARPTPQPTARPTPQPSAQPTPFPTFSVCNTNIGLDIAFLIDESGSIDANEFVTLNSFIKRVVEYDINDASFVSLFQYSDVDDFDNILPFTSVVGNGRTNIINAVNMNQQADGITTTGHAIRETLKYFDTNANNNGRPDLLFVLTDGEPTDTVCDVNNPIDRKNVEIVLIGIGDSVSLDMFTDDEFNCLYDNVKNDVYLIPQFTQQEFNDKEAALREKTCVCNDGWILDVTDGATCLDIDECGAEDHNCDTVNGHCINTQGSYECECNDGFSGNGETCISNLDTVLVKDGAGCASQIKNLGIIATPQQCAVIAATDPACNGNQFMFSGYTSWGCRCCLASTTYGNANIHWDVYEYSTAVLVKDGAGCASQIKNLGNIATPRQCAVIAATDPACSGNQFMFSGYTSWGCRCCPASTTYGNANIYWDVYEYSNVVFVNSAEAETDINLLNDITNDNHEQNGEEPFMKRFIYPDYTYFIPIIGVTLIINLCVIFMVYHFCIKPKFKNHSYDLVDQAKDIQVVH